MLLGLRHDNPAAEVETPRRIRKLPRTLSPAETLTRVNRVLYNDIKRGMFVTVYYCILQLQKALLTWLLDRR